MVVRRSNDSKGQRDKKEIRQKERAIIKKGEIKSEMETPEGTWR
jgi:hypothetical protein